MESAASWLQLQRMKHAAERIEDRLAAHREAISNCHRRMQAWLDTSRLCTWFWRRAERHLLPRLAQAWLALVQEAESAAELEREQAIELDQQLDEIELSARCAWSDYEDVKRAADEHAQHEPAFPILEPTRNELIRP